MNFWNNFENICKKNHLKPNQVGKELNIAASSISGWKKGSPPSSERLEAIANYFGVSCDYLLGRTGSDPELPEDEKELLSDYRKASEDDKNMIRTLAKGAAQKQNPGEKTA